MNNSDFYVYAEKFGVFQKHSMFGGIGLFIQDAMFVLISGDAFYLRGGGCLDMDLRALGCNRYRHVKKQAVVTVNYYDISTLYSKRYSRLDDLIERSIRLSIANKAYRRSAESKRLRDLPNMRLTLERMVKKAGISNVSSFMEFGAVEVYKKVRHQYGENTDINLLWKFAGAVEGTHWSLLSNKMKKELKRTCDLS
ncbi:TfoX/Sxy family DNA transformation protein [Vibrio sp. F74]|uniref:TfoX/Sxy family DNA transformation protein n=1 Tax=Vibrio sp. F74 TaxID=700020 RepID=UPI0035F5E105